MTAPRSEVYDGEYGVFKSDQRLRPIRLGIVLGLQRAIDLMERMYARLPGHYFVLDLGKNEVIASLPEAPENAP